MYYTRMVLQEDLRHRRRGDYKYHLDYRTRWLDNDAYGHLNNSIYFHLIDSIINAFLIEHCGRDPATSDQIGLVVSSHCDFFASLRFPQVAELGLKVIGNIGRSSVTYEVGIFEAGHDEPRAVGGYTHVFVQRSNRRPPTDGIAKEVRAGLSRLTDRAQAKL